MAVHRRVDLAVCVLVVAALLLYAVTDDEVLDRLLYLGMFAAAGAAAWVGAARAPAEQRLVGWLIAAGITLTAVGDTLWELLDATGRATDVSVADPPWLVSYVALCVALSVVLRRSGAGRHDLDFTIDAVTIVVVSVLLLWSTAIDTIVTDESVPAEVRVVWAAYPVADAILLALVVRVLTSRAARSCLDPSFAVGAGLWLAADVAYLQPYGSTGELLMNMAWMVAPVLMARSVWLLRPVPAVSPAPAAHGHPVFQLAIAIGPLLVPPALELVADLRGQPHRPLALMVGATTLTLLAFVRMARLVRSEERAVHELEVARDVALEASRAKSMFLATMSHEIRTPLTMVLGAAEILEDTPLDDLQLELVRRMRRSGSSLRALVDDVLDFSRIEAGEVEIAQVPFDLVELVDGLAEGARPRAEAAGISFDAVVDPDAPRQVVGDPSRLAQVVGNLLDNAVKFTHRGGVHLDVRRVPGGGDTIELIVSDTGIGIPEDHLASVFESFKQVDGSSTRQYGGAGLGLAICTQLITAMGGTLEVTSAEGEGTVFVARLPLPTPEETGEHHADGQETAYDDGARRTAAGLGLTSG